MFNRKKIANANFNLSTRRVVTPILIEKVFGTIEPRLEFRFCLLELDIYKRTCFWKETLFCFFFFFFTVINNAQYAFYSSKWFKFLFKFMRRLSCSSLFIASNYLSTKHTHGESLL